MLSLSSNKKVVIDKLRELEHNTTVVSVCSQFSNNNSFWLQLWKEHQHNWYRMDWQVKLSPIANQSAEAEVVSSSLY